MNDRFVGIISAATLSATSLEALGIADTECQSILPVLMFFLPPMSPAIILVLDLYKLIDYVLLIIIINY